MSEKSLDFIQNQINNAKFVLENYTKNKSGFVYSSRNIFVLIDKYVEDFLSNTENERWIIMPGLRGVGKTTILAQTYTKLNNTNFDSRRLLYIPLDKAVNTLGISLLDVLNAYQSFLGEKFENLSEKIVLFIDEVQADSNWGNIIKTNIFDVTDKVMVIITGSSAVALQAKNNADIIRRSRIEKLFPMNFCEYQIIKNSKYPIAKLKGKIKEAMFESENSEEIFSKLSLLKKDVNKYWSNIDDLEIENYITTGTFPFTVNKGQEKVFDNVNNQLDTIINKDIVELGTFDVKTLKSIKRLLYILADISDAISYAKLAKALDTNHVTLANMMEVLEKAEVLIKLSRLGSNLSKTTSFSKYLFMSPLYRASLLDVTGKINVYYTRQGKMIEDIIGSYLYREFVSKNTGSLEYDYASKGADIVLRLKNKKDIVIEIGRGDKSFEEPLATMKKLGSQIGMVICYKTNELKFENGVVKIPLKYFLLS